MSRLGLRTAAEPLLARRRHADTLPPMFLNRILWFLCLCCVLTGLKAADTPTSTAPATAESVTEVKKADATASTTKRIAYIKIEGVIDPGKSRYYQRAMDEAIEQKVDAVVVHLTTPGGRLDSAIEITKAALAVPEGGPLTVAFVDRESYSAGSLIAYAHNRVYLTNVATLGDIGVIFVGADGKMEYAPEKAETVARAMLRSVAQKNGWSEAKLLKMTARNQDLYRFDLPDGPVWVIEDDLPRFLADHPDVKDEKKILILGEDRLLSYTHQEALADGMATGIVKDLPDLYRTLGGDPSTVLNLAPTSTEELSWTLSGYASLLAALAVLFIILELKTPGIGLWASLAGVCGILFFICQFYMELASYPEVLLILFGIALLVVDLFFLPTGGMLAMVGLTAAMVGLVLAFMPDSTQFAPSSDGWGNSLGVALSNSIMALLVAVGGIIALLLALPKLAVAQRLASVAEITATSDGNEKAVAIINSHIGKRAVARSDLSPNGFIHLNDQEMGAVAQHSEFIKAGTAVIIVDMQFGEAVVRTVTNEAPDLAKAQVPT